ncbi:hypothetical protein [Streptomyces longwoodensis]|uniref:hypothetical protein n=1 Tax=Streptomyces longwoodensis TaxID=68231 RepID=UPI00384BE155
MSEDEKLDLTDAVTTWIADIDLDHVGYLIVGLFLALQAVADTRGRADRRPRRLPGDRFGDGEAYSAFEARGGQERCGLDAVGQSVQQGCGQGLAERLGGRGTVEQGVHGCGEVQDAVLCGESGGEGGGCGLPLGVAAVVGVGDGFGEVGSEGAGSHVAGLAGDGVGGEAEGREGDGLAVCGQFGQPVGELRHGSRPFLRAVGCGITIGKRRARPAGCCRRAGLRGPGRSPRWR